MKHLYQKCPVCDNVLDGTESFCPNCAFELRVLPQHLPIKLREQENSRIENAKRSYLRIRESIDNELSSKDRIGELENAINDYKNDLSAKEKEIEGQKQVIASKDAELEKQASVVSDLSGQVSTLNHTVEELSAANKSNDDIIKGKDQNISQLDDELKKTKDKLGNLEKMASKKEAKIKEQENAISNLNLKVRNLEQKIKATESMPIPPIKEKKVIGYLIMQLLDEEISSVYPVYVGINIYGTNPAPQTKKYTHAINFVSKDLMPEHFSIVVENEDDSVKAQLLSGTWSINNLGNHPKSHNLEIYDEIIFKDFKLIYIENHG